MPVLLLTEGLPVTMASSSSVQATPSAELFKRAQTLISQARSASGTPQQQITQLEETIKDIEAEVCGSLMWFEYKRSHYKFVYMSSRLHSHQIG